MFCLLRSGDFQHFYGVSGRSPEQDAQPFLRVAVGGLEKGWWVRETPKGFRAHSAFLAIHRLAFRLFTLNSIPDRFFYPRQ